MELPDGSQLLVTNALKARSAKISLAHLSFDTVASGSVDHMESLLPRLAAGETFQVIDLRLACQSLHRNGEQAD